MKYEVILFDADDTLFDYGQAEKHALASAFAHYGMEDGAERYKESYKTINSRLWRDLEQGLISSADLRVERFRRLFAENGLELAPEAFSETYLLALGQGSFLIEGAEELCERLGVCRLAIITNGIKDVQLSRIAGSPLHSTFGHVIISEEVGSQKPEQGIFDYAFAKLGLTDADKSKVLIVGDSLSSDIQGGNNYGIDTCWYNPHGKRNETGIVPTYEIASLSGLFAVLEEVKDAEIH